MVDVIAGAPEFHSLVRPYSVVTDSHGRIIVTDPGVAGVHIFDFAQHKYKFIQHLGKGKDAMRTPQCVAVDAQDNIYVTDSDAGVIFVFEPNGKLLHTIGSLKGGEGYFKRPTGIAVDSAAQRIYVTDTLRDEVFILDMQGNVLKTIGKTGEAEGEFNLPTELRLDGPNLMVVDAMNFRVQVFDRSGALPSERSATGRERCFERRRSALTRKAICMRWILNWAWCRSSTARANCCITSASEARMRESFSSRRGCSSIMTTVSMSWIRSTTAFRYFITPA
jgi:hypothetical protein